MMGERFGKPAKIYVRLLDEGVDVWRPAEASQESDGLSLSWGHRPNLQVRSGSSLSGLGSAVNGASSPVALKGWWQSHSRNEPPGHGRRDLGYVT